MSGEMIAKKDLEWLGTTQSITHIGEFMVIEVLHNKIQNRESDTLGYHIFRADGSNVLSEYFPTLPLCLLALALVMDGKTAAGAVPWMAKVGDLATGT
jgi:hypothetical protein